MSSRSRIFRILEKERICDECRARSGEIVGSVDYILREIFDVVLQKNTDERGELHTIL